MKDTDFIFEAFGGTGAFARVIGKPIEHASVIRVRDRIPVAYWQAIVDAAQEQGIEGITYERLVELHAGKSRKREAAE